ncbi:MAG: hypothetical protein KBS69_04985 [Bacteroidales bacterium]|nr:hypothetical protein [Candidatus Colicola caccequi]
MKKLFLSLLLSTMAFTMINATISLAVMDFKPGSSKANNLEGLSDMLINSLYESGNYDIVERSQINSALKELQLQGKDLSTADLTKMGQYLKVSHVLVGTVNFIPTGNSSDPGFVEGEYNIDVRIVDVKSSRVVATAGVTKNSSQTYRSLMPELANQLSSKLNTNSLPCIQGYLYLYPEDLGCSSLDGTTDKIKHLNAVNAYGRKNWRLPTIDELKLIANNKHILGYEVTGDVFSNNINTYSGTYYYRYYSFDNNVDRESQRRDLGEKRIILVSTKE